MTAPRRSRSRARLQIIVMALLQWLCTLGRRKRVAQPRRILIANDLLLGDTLMLTPLLASLRQAYPDAQIVLTVSKASLPLYASHPYGVLAVPFSLRDARSLARLRALGGFDLAFVPGDNRQSWLAMAAGARWIVAHAGDLPAWKNRMVDEALPYPDQAAFWGDMTAALAGVAEPPSYRVSDWPPGPARPLDLPAGPLAVLHVGASSVLKLWEPQRWRDLAAALTERGLTVLWSGGPGEQAIVADIDASQSYRSLAGQLDLAQLHALLARASLLVSPDTSVAHLGRIAGTPTVTLFGPGSPLVSGAGRFWRDSAWQSVAIDPFPCRDQTILFRRNIPWVRRCGRSAGSGPDQCATPRCMQSIGLAMVLGAVDQVMAATRPGCHPEAGC